MSDIRDEIKFAKEDYNQRLLNIADKELSSLIKELKDKNLSIFFDLNKGYDGNFYIDGEPKVLNISNEEVDITLENMNDISIIYDIVENSLDLDVDHAFILSGEGLGYEYILDFNNIDKIRL